MNFQWPYLNNFFTRRITSLFFLNVIKQWQNEELFGRLEMSFFIFFLTDLILIAMQMKIPHKEYYRQYEILFHICKQGFMKKRSI